MLCVILQMTMQFAKGWTIDIHLLSSICRYRNEREYQQRLKETLERLNKVSLGKWKRKGLHHLFLWFNLLQQSYLKKQWEDKMSEQDISCHHTPMKSSPSPPSPSLSLVQMAEPWHVRTHCAVPCSGQPCSFWSCSTCHLQPTASAVLRTSLIFQ